MAAGNVKHDHSAFVGIGHNQPCRLCAAVDEDALIEQLASDLWESRQTGDEFIAWIDAGEYWQRGFRQLAETAVTSLSAPSCRMED